MVKLQNKCHLWFLRGMALVICAKFYVYCFSLKAMRERFFYSSPPPSRNRVPKTKSF